MRRLGVMLSVVAAATIATAADYEFTPVAGYVIKEGNLNLDNELLVGGEFQFNRVGETIHPEFSLLYTPEDEYDDDIFDTEIMRVALNGVHEYDALGIVTPFAKAGFGYEHMSRTLYENDSNLFLDVGAGIKVPLTDAMALKLEAVYMLKDLDDRRDSNLMTLVGLSFPFGGEEQPAVVAEETVKAVGDSDGDGVNDDADACPYTLKGVAVDARGCALDSDGDGVVNTEDKCPETPKGAVVDVHGCPFDSDKDGVIDVFDKCPDTPEGAAVDVNGCPFDSDKDGVIDAADACPNTPEGAAVDAQGCPLDSDKDGVIDLFDKCPGTPEGFKVDTDGCPLTMDLALVFETDSAKVDAASSEKVAAFGTFLLENTGYNVHVVGHTDDRGMASYNQNLSEKRANAVRDMLVEQGVDAGRITTEGKGEAEPKADNATAEGRQANRRIEVQLQR